MFAVALLLRTGGLKAQTADKQAQVAAADTTTGLIHRFEVDLLPDRVLHTNEYLEGDNLPGRTVNALNSVSLKYAFQFDERSERALAYGQPRQGIGLTKHWGDRLIGSPWSVFLFQGAQIATMGRRMSLDYEWKFGLTTGWETYDNFFNPTNRVFGARTTALMNLSLMLDYRLCRWLDVSLGLTATHYSNGNTRFPNAGLNTLGGRLSLTYLANRHDDLRPAAKRMAQPVVGRNIYFDLMLYGAWCTAGVMDEEGKSIALDRTYAVCGLNLAPMYRFSHLFAAGVSVDAVYDRSANLQLASVKKQIVPYDHKPDNQTALGLSARGEFMMPFFTINAGVGVNVIGAKGDLKGIYQVLALKIDIFDGLYANIGYTLHDFSDPDHLMFGLGFRY